MNNPLLYPFETLHQAAPFSTIETSHFLPALKAAIAQAQEELEALVGQTAPPSFENTIERLDSLGELLDRNAALLYNLNAAETTPELQKVTQEAAPLLSNFQNTLRLDPRLFQRIKQVYEHTDKALLTKEQQTLLEKQYKGFTRNGALLNNEQKEQLRNIDTELAQLSLTFGEHVLADTQNYFLHLTDTDALKGLPQAVVDAAAEMAQQKKLDGWVFTLDYPSYVPFMTYAENRSLRQKLATAFGKKGFQDNENNNTAILLKIVRLRKERAQLLGYSSHAAFVLEERMAQSETQVRSFLELLREKASPVAEKEWQALKTLAKEHLQGAPIQKWDTAFLTEKLKQQQLELDEQKLKPYFELDKVLQGLFDIIGELYGLNFKRSEAVEGYHPDVHTYEVRRKSGDFVALLYMDFFPRPGKRNGAWMTSYISQKKGRRPHVSVVCNFTPPTEKAPSLLTFQEVTTLFHEFGHALHGMLADTVYSGLSGTNVYWDFVELPSQLLENWCYEREALKRFAQHYLTGELLPEEAIEKLKKTAQFQQGLQTLRQLSFALLDLSYHGEKADAIKDVKKHELEVLAAFQKTPDIAENTLSTAFSHIFQGGYSAGYYSYKWAEVLDADAFEHFKENGILNPKVAQDFADTILSKGGTEHPMELYKKFRGKEPSVNALLERSGLLS